MLVQFRFKNYGPFKNETVFDMRAVRAYKEHPCNLIEDSDKSCYLKVAAIYGANASGKSNFVDAYSCFLNIVQWSFSKNEKNNKDPFLASNYYPFLFDKEYFNDDTEFEGIFRKDDVEFRYGFSYNRDRVNFEWLYKKSVGTNRSSKILERTPDGIELGYTVRNCEKYLSDIDDDVLALSFFSSLKLRSHVFKETLGCITDFLPISRNFSRNIDAILDDYFVESFSEDERPIFVSFLNAIDVGIKDVEVNRNDNKTAVYTFHEDKEGNLIKVPIEIESDGTKKAMAIFSLLRTAVSGNLGIIIDELNMQLHPLLTKYIIDLFSKESSKAQLIYTTHDTVLLNKKYMRRDQIWFTEKDCDGASTLYSLADFRIRNDESYEKEYLSGIFGAIPSFDDFSFDEVGD